MNEAVQNVLWCQGTTAVVPQIYSKMKGLEPLFEIRCSPVEHCLSCVFSRVTHHRKGIALFPLSKVAARNPDCRRFPRLKLCALQHIPQREARLKPRDSRQARKLVLVQASVVVDARSPAPPACSRIGRPSDGSSQFRGNAGRRSRSAQHGGRLPLQRDPDIDRHALAEQPIIDQRPIAADRARCFPAPGCAATPPKPRGRQLRPPRSSWHVRGASR